MKSITYIGILLSLLCFNLCFGGNAYLDNSIDVRTIAECNITERIQVSLSCQVCIPIITNNSECSNYMNVRSNNDCTDSCELVPVCHIPVGNPLCAHEIFLSPTIAPLYLSTGDTLGHCAKSCQLVELFFSYTNPNECNVTIPAGSINNLVLGDRLFSSSVGQPSVFLPGHHPLSWSILSSSTSNFVWKVVTPGFGDSVISIGSVINVTDCPIGFVDNVNTTCFNDCIDCSGGLLLLDLVNDEDICNFASKDRIAFDNTMFMIEVTCKKEEEGCDVNICIWTKIIGVFSEYPDIASCFMELLYEPETLIAYNGSSMSMEKALHDYIVTNVTCASLCTIDESICRIVAENNTIRMKKNTTHEGSLFGLVQNGSPPFMFTYVIFFNHGIHNATATIGPYTFIPPEDFTGKAELFYRVGDGYGCTSVGIITIMVGI